MFGRMYPLSLFPALAFSLLTLASPAQTNQHSILTGAVTDPSDAAVGNAQVTLVNNTSHIARHTSTNQTGLYVFSSIPTGTYTLTVDAANFARYENRALTVADSQNYPVNIQLQVSSVSQSMTVQGDTASLTEISTLDKTGTKLEDLPASVQLIPAEVLSEQGDTMLRQGVTNASGINYGGTDSKGFYDHFVIRGLNATIYSDGFTDGDQLNGVSHSLNGIERIEILEGPGSALFGSGAPGGTINLVHYTPSSVPYYGVTLQGGSFGTVYNNDYLTGPTGIANLNYRVDATFAHSDGFRNLSSHDYELRPALEWQLTNHVLNFTVDARHTRDTPDSYGLIYFKGSPISGVPNTAKYSTPFTFANQPFIRPTLTDTWTVSNHLTLNNRFSFLHRQLDFLGNGDSTKTMVSGGQVIGRQLRQQADTDNDYDYQFEPVWNFTTGRIHHTLLTGFEFLRQKTATARSTADLPNIPNAFAPVPPETSTAGLTFLCDSKHSCDNDRLAANYFSVYATDQVDVTQRLKLRAGFRQDWFNTTLLPLLTVPGRLGPTGQPIIAGAPDSRNDAPTSWSAGALYKITSSIIPYFGASTSHLANFSSENTQNGVGAPEAALQYEAGIKFPLLNNRLALNTAFFNVNRNNVATLITLNGIETVVFDSQRTRGFEASFDGKVTEQWHMLANVTTQDAVITDNPQGVTSQGNHPQGVPANIANLWTTYNLSHTALRGLKVGAGLNYLAKSWSDITDINSIPSFVIGNATVSYARSSWNLHLNVDNFTDRRYFIAANAAGAYQGNPASVYGGITWNPGLHSR